RHLDIKFCRPEGQPCILTILGQSLENCPTVPAGRCVSMEPVMAYASSEDALVRRISRRFPAFRASRVHLAAGDDAALWEARAGYETILTSDWFLEESHFLRKLHPADAVGWKCLARAASDMAAMGGTPRCFLLNVALPDSCAGKWIDA